MVDHSLKIPRKRESHHKIILHFLDFCRSCIRILYKWHCAFKLVIQFILICWNLAMHFVQIPGLGKSLIQPVKGRNGAEDLDCRPDYCGGDHRLVYCWAVTCSLSTSEIVNTHKYQFSMDAFWLNTTKQHSKFRRNPAVGSCGCRN